MTGQPISSDILLFNGRVFGGALRGQPVWGEAVLFQNGRIAAVGRTDDIPRNPNTRVINLDGALLLPGLCDAHMHLAAGGQSLGITDLSHLSRAGVEAALRRAAELSSATPDAWLEAFNWDERDCRLSANLLEEWIPGRPLIVHKRDLHGCCCNRTALRMAGIAVGRSDPPGGEIGRLADGQPSGMLFEEAIGLVQSIRPKPSKEARRRFILKAQDQLLKQGLTAVSEVLDSGNEDIYAELDRCGDLRLDVDGWLRIEEWDGKSPPSPSPPVSGGGRGGRFRVHTLKFFLDGSFGSRTAALAAPFEDGSGSGILRYGDPELLEITERAVATGWRLALHAIGDCAAEQACRVLKEMPKPKSGMHRIEHLQLLPKNGVDLVVNSGAVASVQPIHLLDDQSWLPERIGPERCRRSFVWRSLTDRGVVVACGSDWPVASSDPLLNLQAAIRRAPFWGAPHPLFDASEALPPWLAVRGMSWAYAAVTGRTGARGAIMPGLQADFTAVRGAAPDLDDWSRAEVVLTISRGEILFNRLTTT